MRAVELPHVQNEVEKENKSPYFNLSDLAIN
jgi:hypothetical protein